MLRRFRLTRYLGSGVSGSVYRALAPGGVDAAVKIIQLPTPEAAQRELRWLELLKSTRHVFLLPIHEFWQDGQSLCVVMELADMSLRDWLSTFAANQANVPLAELQRYTSETAEAIDHINARGILHRDIKPDNILLVGSHAKLGDCGLARTCEKEWLHKATCVGTPFYMAPEAWFGEPTPASDQYSLAVTYAELRTGRPPFQGQTLAALLDAHCAQTADLGFLDGQEKQVILKALAKRPNDRYPTCMAFVQALRETTTTNSGLQDYDPRMETLQVVNTPADEMMTKTV